MEKLRTLRSVAAQFNNIITIHSEEFIYCTISKVIYVKHELNPIFDESTFFLKKFKTWVSRSFPQQSCSANECWGFKEKVSGPKTLKKLKEKTAESFFDGIFKIY